MRPALVVLIVSIACMGILSMYWGFNEVATAAVAGLAAGLGKLTEQGH